MSIRRYHGAGNAGPESFEKTSMLYELDEAGEVQIRKMPQLPVSPPYTSM